MVAIGQTSKAPKGHALLRAQYMLLSRDCVSGVRSKSPRTNQSDLTGDSHGDDEGSKRKKTQS
jgi:hypothetical protein